MTIRGCLRCRKSFESEWVGNRLCYRCKRSIERNNIHEEHTHGQGQYYKGDHIRYRGETKREKYEL